MIKLRVLTIFKGMVAIREKYLKRASIEGLVIKYKDKQMTLRASEVKNKKVGRSEKPVKDMYGGKEEYLIFYKWRPDDIDQQKLL